MKSLLCFVATFCVAGFVHADQGIRSLQQTLKDQGLYYGAVTGEKSAETTAAIRRYQIRNGLHVTGEINDETTRFLNASSNSVAMLSQTNSKGPAHQVDSIRADPSLNHSSRPPSFSQADRDVETNPSYSTSFYQSAPSQLNRRAIAEAQYQLKRWGYYRGRIDGTYGSRTAFAVRAFQSGAGLPVTGRFDTQTLGALGSFDTDFAHVASPSRPKEAWIPVTKFKHGKWKVKWKKYDRLPDGEHGDDQQTNSDFAAQSY
jgi:peptidoglycan hydrolase-like protein with peptidoglycan-binding domain